MCNTTAHGHMMAIYEHFKVLEKTLKELGDLDTYFCECGEQADKMVCLAEFFCGLKGQLNTDTSIKNLYSEYTKFMKTKVGYGSFTDEYLCSHELIDWAGDYEGVP